MERLSFYFDAQISGHTVEKLGMVVPVGTVVDDVAGHDGDGKTEEVSGFIYFIVAFCGHFLWTSFWGRNSGEGCEGKWKPGAWAGGM